MAIKFEFYETPDPSGKKSGKYHARTVSEKTVSTKQLAEEIQEASSLTIPDVNAVLSALSRRIAFHLGESERVHLQGIGYFQATLTTTREIDPKKTRAQSVWFKSVKFRADSELNKQLRPVRTERSPRKIHSDRFTNEEVDNAVEKLLGERNFVTRLDIERLLNMTRSTTQRHINRMLEEGKIKNTNTRKQPIYVLNKQV